MRPKPLGGEPVDVRGDEDRREKLADWLVSPANPFFAKAAVNRIWYHLMGRGIVEPVDDFRESNPPASAELLKALADDFVAHGFNVKRTIRLILNSRVYQLSSLPNEFNAEDTRYFSHATVRMLSAEQILDSSCLAAGCRRSSSTCPQGRGRLRCRTGSSHIRSPKDFGQPARAEACECERGSDSTLEQALQVVGGRTLHGKIIAQENRLGELLGSGADNATLVEQLFLATLSRYPSTPRRVLAESELSDPGHRPPPAGRRGPVLDPAESPRVLVPALRTPFPVRTTVAVRRAPWRSTLADKVPAPIRCHSGYNRILRDLGYISFVSVVPRGRPGPADSIADQASWPLFRPMARSRGDGCDPGHKVALASRLHQPARRFAWQCLRDYQPWALARECHRTSVPVDETLFFGL